MTEQWQELKETIIELRDNNGTATQQEVCKFLANLMDVLEKQMQEPCDAISRKAVLDILWHTSFRDDYEYKVCKNKIIELPPVNPQPICEEREKGECPYYAG